MSTDVMLVYPFSLSKHPVQARLKEPYLPLGLLYIAAVLRQAGLKVEVFDATFTEGEDDFRRALVRSNPRYVGISAQDVTRTQTRSFAKMVRQAGVPVILGGPDPTSRPIDYLGEHGGDIVVVGEGEDTVVELWHALETSGGRRPPDEALRHIQGLAYLDHTSDRLVMTPRRPAVVPLDKVPFPARDLIDVERYRQAWRDGHRFFALSIITSRGCPFRCNWCARPVFGRLYRQRSPENVVDELLALRRDFRPDRLRVLDDIFPLNKQWLRAWHAETIARQAVVPFECLSRVDLVDVPTLRLLKEAGCWRVCYGAESGSQRVLDAMDKGIRVEDTYRAAAATREVGIRSYFFVMLGYPGEERSDVELTRKMLREILPDEFSVSTAYPLPGTEFYQQVRDSLADKGDWRCASDKVTLFQQGRYGTHFYRLVERLLHREVEIERSRHGLARVSALRRLRVKLELPAIRCLVHLLSRIVHRQTRFRPVNA